MYFIYRQQQVQYDNFFYLKVEKYKSTTLITCEIQRKYQVSIFTV